MKTFYIHRKNFYTNFYLTIFFIDASVKIVKALFRKFQPIQRGNIMNKVLLIDPKDNVVTALEPVTKGERCTAFTEGGEENFTTLQNIPMGHKLAVRAIPKGTPVRKYGSAIGDATADIAAGEHVHSHNLSGYRGRE